MKCTGMLNGSEWWYGFLSRMETISIREGLASRSPFASVRSTDLWQYTAYFPTSLLGGRKCKECGFRASGMRCFWQLTLGRRCVAGTVSGTTGNVVEEGRERRTETAAASTVGN